MRSSTKGGTPKEKNAGPVIGEVQAISVGSLLAVESADQFADAGMPNLYEGNELPGGLSGLAKSLGRCAYQGQNAENVTRELQEYEDAAAWAEAAGQMGFGDQEDQAVDVE